MAITLKIKDGKMIKQTFNKDGHGLLIIPLLKKNQEVTLYAQDIINEVTKE